MGRLDPCTCRSLHSRALLGSAECTLAASVSSTRTRLELDLPRPSAPVTIRAQLRSSSVCTPSDGPSLSWVACVLPVHEEGGLG